MHIKPYKNKTGTKKEQVAGMFDNIAFRYDFLNHFLSANIDKIWRRKVINIIAKKHPKTILDVATGTGDLAIAALKVHPEKVEGIDISEGMLEVGRKKLDKKGLSRKVELHSGDAENIPFPDERFDAVTVAFGVRNFENLEKGLAEMQRVLKPNGVCVVLEFTLPRVFPVKQLYQFYFKYLLPAIGRVFSKDDSAYTYLPESVKAFPQRHKFIEKLNDAGFKNAYFNILSGGIAAIYVGEK